MKPLDKIETDLANLASHRALEAVHSVTQLCDNGPLRYAVALSAAGSLLAHACQIMVESTKGRKRPATFDNAARFAIVQLAEAFGVDKKEHRE